MTDHERSPRRQTSLGAANPHPSTACPSPEPRPVRGGALTKADIAQIEAWWTELGDIGLVLLRVPFRWRPAAKLVVELMEAERRCKACGACYRVNPECPGKMGKKVD